MDESGNRLTIQNYTVRHLIREAYGLKSDSQILGGPDWIDKQASISWPRLTMMKSARMDKMSDDQSDREWDLMLQSLLADRFQFRVRARAVDCRSLLSSSPGPAAKLKHTPVRARMPKRAIPASKSIGAN